MSLGLLLDKYDVSTADGLQKALGEIEKEELEVDSALSGALANACTLEGRLRAASQAYSKLGEVKTDTIAAADMVEKTATLARDVSAKVRQLDLARSRVAECQRRVHDLIDLQLCSAGVEAAIRAHDYETGAAHVSRFLVMDPGSVAAARARGEADPRHLMAKAADTLRDHLVKKFEEAARKDDAECIERLYKLFPQIGRAEEGVQLYAKYLANQLEATIRRVSVVAGQTGPGQTGAGQTGAGQTGAGQTGAGEAVFVDALTRVLEAGAAAAQTFLQAAHVAPFSILQQKICSGARHVYRQMCSLRRLDAAALCRAGAEARAAEPDLAELALMHSRLYMYFSFLRRRTQAAAASLKEEERKKCCEEMEKIISECELTRIAQDVLGHYLALERYFLEESVGKALKLSTPQPGATSSSLVDDVFYIARKVIRRSVSTGSVDGLCAVLNEVAGVLERDVAAALRRRLRTVPPHALPLAPPAPPAAAPAEPGLLAARLNRDLDAQRALFLAHTCEAESGAEWAERLAAEAIAEAEPLLTNQTARDKVESCAVGLGAAAASFRAAHELALAGIRAAMAPGIAAWAQHLASPEFDPEELEEDAQQLPSRLEWLLESARASLGPRAAHAVLLALLRDVTHKAELLLLDNYYTREGGECVERRVRRVTAWCGGAGVARDSTARLRAAAALLACEAEAPAGDVTRLDPQLARAIRARRIDIKTEDLKKFKL